MPGLVELLDGWHGSGGENKWKTLPKHPDYLFWLVSGEAKLELAVWDRVGDDGKPYKTYSISKPRPKANKPAPPPAPNPGESAPAIPDNDIPF